MSSRPTRTCSTAAWVRFCTNRTRLSSLAALRWDLRVEQCFDCGPDRVSRGAAILVHTSGDRGPVVQQEQLPSELLWGACAGCLGKVGEEGPQESPVLLAHDLPC